MPERERSPSGIFVFWGCRLTETAYNCRASAAADAVLVGTARCAVRGRRSAASLPRSGGLQTAVFLSADWRPPLLEAPMCALRELQFSILHLQSSVFTAGGIAQLVERQLCKLDVRGSNPLASIFKYQGAAVYKPPLS